LLRNKKNIGKVFSDKKYMFGDGGFYPTTGVSRLGNEATME
jgi:hypothetical protein